MSLAELSGAIRKIAVSAALEIKATITDGALRWLTQIPPPYNREKQIDVELAQLHEAIRTIIAGTAADNPNRVIGDKTLQFAMQRVPCHYLWFC
jgi:hypothetical protein